MKVWTRRPGTYTGKRRDFGEVFDLPSGPKVEQLLRLGYLEKAPGRSPVKCGDCGAAFTGDAERNRHGQLRHRRRAPAIVRDLDDLSHAELHRLNYGDHERRVRYGEHYQPVVSDGLEDVEAEEKFLEEKAPLHLDKTAASRK